MNFGTSIHSTEIESTALRTETEQRAQDLRSSSLQTHIPLEGRGLCQRVTLWPERPDERPDQRGLRPDDKMEGRASRAEEMACSSKHRVLLGMRRKAQNAARCSMKGTRSKRRTRSHKPPQTVVTSLDFTVVIMESEGDVIRSVF